MSIESQCNNCIMCVMFNEQGCGKSQFKQDVKGVFEAGQLMGWYDLFSIKQLAERQLETIKTCYGGASLINSGFFNHSHKEKASQLRWIKRELADAVAAETAMVEKAFSRPEDIEEFTNSDLVGAIHALTASRINRIAYAGRKLP